MFRSLASNYRPVSLTCVPSKLLGHIICSNIMAHLNEHKLLSDKQYVFRYGLFLLVGNDAALNIVTQITHRT